MAWLKDIIVRWRTRRRWRRAAVRLYGAAAGAARSPALYGALEVPDSFDGRFDAQLVMLHLVLRRVRRDRAVDPVVREEVNRLLLELAVADWDRSLREAGVGDLMVGRHIKRMMTAALGRLRAYDQAMDAPDGAAGKALARALARNLWREDKAHEAAHKLAAWVIATQERLWDAPLEDLPQELAAAALRLSAASGAGKADRGV